MLAAGSRRTAARQGLHGRGRQAAGSALSALHHAPSWDSDGWAGAPKRRSSAVLRPWPAGPVRYFVRCVRTSESALACFPGGQRGAELKPRGARSPYPGTLEHVLLPKYVQCTAVQVRTWVLRVCISKMRPLYCGYQLLLFNTSTLPGKGIVHLGGSLAGTTGSRG